MPKQPEQCRSTTLWKLSVAYIRVVQCVQQCQAPQVLWAETNPEAIPRSNLKTKKVTLISANLFGRKNPERPLHSFSKSKCFAFTLLNVVRSTMLSMGCLVWCTHPCFNCKVYLLTTSIVFLHGSCNMLQIDLHISKQAKPVNIKFIDLKIQDIGLYFLFIFDCLVFV